MIESQTKEFPKGLFAAKPKQNAPQFIKAKISVKVKDFIEYLDSKDEEWLNFDVLESKDGTKFYLQQDTWKPNTEKDQPVKTTNITPDIDPEDIPF